MFGIIATWIRLKLNGGVSPENMDMEENFGINLQNAQRLRAIPIHA